MRQAHGARMRADALDVAHRLRGRRADLAHAPAVDHHHAVVDPAQDVRFGGFGAPPVMSAVRCESRRPSKPGSCRIIIAICVTQK